PTSDSVSPRLTKKVTSSTAFTRPTVFWRSPLRMGKYFLSPLTSRSTDFSEPASPALIVAAFLSLVEKAACLSSSADILQKRILGIATAGNERNATGMEGATLRPVEGMGNRPADGGKLQLRH